MPEELIESAIEGEEEIVVFDDELPETPLEEAPPAPIAAAPPAEDEDGDEIAALEKETGNPLFGPWKERLSKTQKRRDEHKKNFLAEQARRKELEELRVAEAEEARRTTEQALLYAHQMREEAAAALKQKAELEAAYRENGLQSNASALGSLQEQYRQALENADHDKAAKIASAMAQVTARQQQFESWRPSGEVQLPEPPQIQPRQVASPLAEKWGEANKWFFPDSPDHNPDKRAYAEVVNAELIRSRRYDPSTPAFYQAVDFYIKQRFPDAPAAPAPNTQPRQVSSPVAPPTASVAPGSGVRQTTVTADDRAAAAVFGIDAKEIARNRLRMEIAAGRM